EWDCPSFQKRLLRERDYLFYLPKPDAVPKNDMIESFVNWNSPSSVAAIATPTTRSASGHTAESPRRYSYRPRLGITLFGALFFGVCFGVLVYAANHSSEANRMIFIAF